MFRFNTYLIATASKSFLLVLLCVFGCLQVEIAWGQNGEEKIENGDFFKPITENGWLVEGELDLGWTQNPYLNRLFCMRAGSPNTTHTGTTTLLSNEMDFCKKTKVVVSFDFTSYVTAPGSLKVYLGGIEICKINFYNKIGLYQKFEIEPASNGMEVYIAKIGNTHPYNYTKVLTPSTYEQYSISNKRWYNIKITIPEYSQTQLTSRLRFEYTDNSIWLIRYAYIDNVQVKEYDKTPPTLTITAPEKFPFCVKDIKDAAFDGNDDITPERPDYYITKDGDLNIAYTGQDNCCEEGELELNWEIEGTPHKGTGQPLENITLELGADKYASKNYTINYWLKDCNGNEGTKISRTITIKPRPKIDFVNN